MKRIIEKIIRKRNSNFSFDDNLSSFALIQFIFLQTAALLRGIRVVLFFKKPNGILLGENVKFFNIPAISWGRFLKLGANVYISALGKTGVTFGNNVGIGAYSQIVVSTSLSAPCGFIKIGNNVGIGEYAYLGGAGGLDIGNDCIVGQYFSCHPQNHNYEDVTVPFRLQGVTQKGIKIGSNCWIGSKVTVLDGVIIGDNCVIAAGSVVTKSIESNSVIAGVPAKIIKQICGRLNAA